MRWKDIAGIDIADLIEAKPVGGSGGVKPLTPTQMRARQKRVDKANAKVRDTMATNAIKLQAAQCRARSI